MVEWTGLNLHQVMDMNIIEFFNLVVFDIDWNEFRERQMRQMIKRK